MFSLKISRFLPTPYLKIAQGYIINNNTIDMTINN